MAKYRKYAEYKDSGVEWLGEIPSHWKVVKLSYKLRLLSGDGITAFDIEDTGTYPVFGGNGLRGFTEKYNCDGEYALVGRQGALCGNINVARGKFFATEHAVVVYPYEKFNLTYLSEFLRFMDLGQYSVSAAQPGIAVDRINALPIVTPTLDEQNSIGDFLDHETAKIDHLIEKQQQLIELLKEKRQAVISHAVTKGLNPNVPMKDSGVAWLGEVPEHWDVIYIKHLTEVKRGASPRPIDDPKYFDDEGEYAWTRIADVTKAGMYLTDTTQKLSKLGSSLSVRLEPNELFLSIAGTVGKPCITVFKACIHDGFVYFPTLKMNNKFLYYIFEAGQAYLGLGKMGTQLNLNTDTVGGIKIGLPPNFEIEQIISYIETQNAKYDFLILTANKQVSLLQERRTALISAAVTGKIDVRNWQAPTVAEADTELSA
ncbi:restriction endonuclease subunit S [Acinetobacter baumannii]|uniref:restriction endonuclease subunit S n=1 Tax=Acinetobacter baumannii TaxID=470 RepID=UPI001230381B|nr:restriction endonuclease subunit S [Acinetobacter baumannii]